MSRVVVSDKFSAACDIEPGGKSDNAPDIGELAIKRCARAKTKLSGQTFSGHIWALPMSGPVADSNIASMKLRAEKKETSIFLMAIDSELLSARAPMPAVAIALSKLLPITFRVNLHSTQLWFQISKPLGFGTLEDALERLF